MLTEGGQIWSHRFKMIRQVIKIAINWSLLVCLLYLVYTVLSLPSSLYLGAWYHLKASFLNLYKVKKVEVNRNFWYEVSHANFAKNPSIDTSQVLKITQPLLNQFSQKLEGALWRSTTVFGFALMTFIVFFVIRGTSRQGKKHLHGNKVVSPWWLSLQLKLSDRASHIKVGNLPLLKDSETRHFLITGGTGSGKTNCLFSLLDQIRRAKQKSIIIDTTGVFTSRYYRPGKDILLNPSDPRSALWHPWIECQDNYDYEAMAESFIPHSHSEHENYWRISSKTLLSSLLNRTALSKKNSDLARWALFEPLPKLCQFVQGTKAAAHMDMNSDKTAASIRSVCASFLGSFEMLKDTDTPFSVKNWIQNPETDSWLFLTCAPAQRTTLIPLIGCWFSVAARSLMQMPPDFERRTWFILDELPSLNKLRDLEMFLAESRKYGGCAVLAIQTPAQLDAIYGRETTKTLLSNCSTKLVFAEYNPESAQSISKAFGDRETIEYNEGLSYGAHEVRDGVTLTAQKKSSPLVSPNEIMSLEPHTAFVKLPGKLPITKIKLDLNIA